MLLIVYAMFPFFVRFEHKKPQARELVTIAVMSAVAVASRAAFIMVPFFKPLTGIVMITGMALGPEAGFLTGAISGFVSNFIFGQGPWTPWQMLGFGLVGFLGGVLFAKLLNLFLPEGKKLNPMIGAAGISAFPMSGRVVNKMGLEEDNQNFLLMYSISVNVSGQIASVLAGGLILSLMA